METYPTTRLRRLRQAPWVREMVAETRLHPSDLILPLFVREGEGNPEPIRSLPGVARLSIPQVVATAKAARDAGIPAVALFPVVSAALRSPDAGEAFSPDNLVCRTIRAIKAAVPEIGIIGDVALDPYTSHGQDGLVVDGEVQNDLTVAALCKQALVLAEAGCDVVAPSDMMDGRIGAIRQALEAAGHTHTLILSYAVKYASSCYGPFRDAVGSAATLGKADKRSYQMDPANSDEALREVALDIAEGADMVMVKPGLPYLDVLYRIASTHPVPVLAYQVSGEYAMIHAAGSQGYLDTEAVMMESLLALKRAGARAIFTYAALEIATGALKTGA
jgi:porphobilinogen synthase